MAMTINTNVVSLNAQRNLGLSGNSLSTTMQRLSSGLRINSAKDDAAGLAIAERMNAQARGLAVAARNANDGISLAQTAEGALGKMGDMLQRMRELAVQSSNATNSDQDRAALQAEVTQLTAEIDRVAKTTTFNGRKILDGSFSGGVFQVGSNAGDNITVGDITNAKAGALGKMDYAANTLTIKTADVTDLSEIAAGTLKISTNGQDIDLGKINKANTVQERVGQIVAAINSKTADTGMTAFMKSGANAGEFSVELRSSGTKDVKDPVTGVTTKQAVAVGLKGFTAEQTGMKVWDLAEPANGDGYGDFRTDFNDARGKFALNTTTPALPAALAADPATYTAAKGAYDSLKSSYDALIAGAITVAAGVSVAQDGSATGATKANLTYAAFETLATGIGYTIPSTVTAQKDASGWLAATTDANVESALEGMVAWAKTDGNGVGSSALFHWAKKTDFAEVLAAPLAADEPFVPANYTAADMLAKVNSTLKLTGDKALKAEDVWGAGTDTTNLMASTNGVPGAWAGTGDAQFENAATAWKAAQAFLESKGALGIAEARDIETETGIEKLSVTTQEGAWVALQTIDKAIDQVNSARGSLGALQTRFEKAVENIDIQNENISASRGRIVDADFAAETANLSRSQILQQAGTAMVAQANQLSQNVLSLLR